jgi:hypothetical protein
MERFDPNKRAEKALCRTCVRTLTVLTMLTMIYLFENTSDRE